MPRRIFTVEEAQAALAEVRPLVERMVAHRRALAAAVDRQSRLGGTVAGNGGDLVPSDFHEILEAIEREAREVAAAVEGLHELGVLVKDLDSGLVDFPARRGDEIVLLCWRLGESEIGFWHGEHDGFAGRRPLPL